jgi:diguanylate cyclase (GGDEF)-like protein/PAS domain S-box-containing protein
MAKETAVQPPVDMTGRQGLSAAGGIDRLQATIDAIRHGVLVLDRNGTISACNRKAAGLLGLATDTPCNRLGIAAIIERLGSAIVLEKQGENAVTVQLPGGAQVEMHVQYTRDSGAIILIEDVTLARERERALRQAESEYRSLFENSVYGIYRDTLDGKPLRLNKALANIYGFSNEADCIAAIRDNPLPAYVDPETNAKFMEMLARDGMVTDFVSQARNRKTGELIWLTENAWYVRDENGVPLFIEGTMLDATKRIQAEEAVQQQANFDSLTGARSRYRFLKTMEQMIASGDKRFVLYCIDLDMFKDINDVFGHAAGDELLRAVVRRLDRICGGREGVARLGGDEFAVMCAKPRAVENPGLMAAEIVSAMREPFVIEGHTHHIGASVGIAAYPDHASGSEELLQNADTALYEAKASGRNGWRLFDQQLRMALENRKAIERGLRTAIAREELSMHYQAVHDIKMGKIAGFESLMRWKCPELGSVSPGVFIPVAEQAGLMSEIGAWAIGQACQGASILGGNQHVSVNLSASQLRSADLLSLIETEMKRHKVKPGRLVVEITESVLVSSQAPVQQLLARLHELGVKIAIDDFGTGYSSLSYLQRMPISVVKIDRSFVVGMNKRANAAVLRAVMGIGEELGIRIVAEGVETVEQLELLKQLGCRYIQGYLFSKPVPLAEAAADLAACQLGRLQTAPSTIDRAATSR